MTVNIARAAAEARALRLALATRVGWTPDSTGPALSTPFAGYLHIAAAHLLLVPTTAGLDYAKRQVEPATRSCRSDAIIVSRGENGTEFAYAGWSRTCTGWIMPLALWLGDAGDPWLVPPPGSFDRLGVRLVNALHTLTRRPWGDLAGRQAGFERATAWLTELDGAECLPRIERK